jgi:hypothetical protein
LVNGHIEATADLTHGGLLSSPRGRAELDELRVIEAEQSRGAGRWLVEQSVS